MDSNNRNGGNKKNNRNLRSVLSLIGWALVLTLVFNYILAMTSGGKSFEITYSQMMNLVQEDQIKKIELKDGVLYATPVDGYTYTQESSNKNQQPRTYTQSEKNPITLYTTYLTDTRLLPLLDEHDVEYSSPVKSSWSVLGDILVMYILPMLLTMGLIVLVMRIVSKNGGGIGGIGNVGKSNAKVYMEKQTGVTFKDVAGQDEAKESLEEIIDFLHNPDKYTAIGAKLPKGALLVGSPGTGKTLLAKAVAGEARVPFFSISGSDFVEMFVGVGASRVRDLFKEASKMAPCIIFIDEIDTIGKSRDNRMGGNDEREQTLNQLLAELDGFDPSKGVIVLGATNRPEVLDKALLRPGRFDRRIIVDRPNLAGRLATLQVHTRNIRLAEDVDLNKIAQATAGCVGADLANLVNEAALRAVRMGRKAVNQNDLLTSFEVVIAGTEKKGTVLTEQEKKLIAYHEVGHALIAARQKGTEPVSKITIVPHTQGALGYTMQTPEEEKFLNSKEELFSRIRILLGGRAAEEVVFHTATTGASNDIERATDLARKMVTMFGMSDTFGIMGLATVKSQYLDGAYGLDCAQDTAALADREIQKILNQCFLDAKNMLLTDREMLDKIASYLLKKETITGQEMMAIIEGRDPALVDNYGTNPNARLENRAQPKADASGVEPPARHIRMMDQLPLPEDKTDTPDHSDDPFSDHSIPDDSDLDDFDDL